MKRKRTRFGTAIIHILRMHNETRHASNRNHVTMVFLNHSRDEFPDHHEVRDGVYFKGFADSFFATTEDCVAGADSGVVDEHGRVPVIFADFGCCGGDF